MFLVAPGRFQGAPGRFLSNLLKSLVCPGKSLSPPRFCRADPGSMPWGHALDLQRNTWALWNHAWEVFWWFRKMLGSQNIFEGAPGRCTQDPPRQTKHCPGSRQHLPKANKHIPRVHRLLPGAPKNLPRQPKNLPRPPTYLTRRTQTPIESTRDFHGAFRHLPGEVKNLLGKAKISPGNTSIFLENPP